MRNRVLAGPNKYSRDQKYIRITLCFLILLMLLLCFIFLFMNSNTFKFQNTLICNPVGLEDCCIAL